MFCLSNYPNLFSFLFFLSRSEELLSIDLAASFSSPRSPGDNKAHSVFTQGALDGGSQMSHVDFKK